MRRTAPYQRVPSAPGGADRRLTDPAGRLFSDHPRVSAQLFPAHGVVSWDELLGRLYAARADIHVGPAQRNPPRLAQGAQRAGRRRSRNLARSPPDPALRRPGRELLVRSWIGAARVRLADNLRRRCVQAFRASLCPLSWRCWRYHCLPRPRYRRPRKGRSLLPRPCCRRPSVATTKDARRSAPFALTSPMRVDGKLDESIYEEIRPASGFIQLEPDGGQPATERTEVWVFYDDEHVY